MSVVTTDEFWRAVGEHLLLVRERKELKPSHLQTLGGPHYDTVSDIERGKIGNLDKLDEYAKALQLEIVDVFRAVLKTDARPLTPEEAQIIRKFETTTVGGRQALLATALVLPVETPSVAAGVPDAEESSTPRKKR